MPSVKLPAVNLRVPMPRLLPVTIVAMAALLMVKSVELVRAAAPAGASEAAPEATAAPAKAPAPAASEQAQAAPIQTAPATPVQTEAKPEGAKPEGAKPEGAKAETARPAEAPAGTSVQLPSGPPISDSERSLLLDLRKRREELDKREAAISEHESLLAAAEARLAARVAELGNLQKRLESLETARKDHDEANWRGLVKLYESMKPKDAATIFNDLDLPVLLPVLDRMKESKAAPVLAAMLPDRARLVTAELAQMRSRANAVPPATPSPAGAGTDTSPAGKPAGG
jgi:flagellar motility protein MotE (MotC chaperone)